MIGEIDPGLIGTPRADLGFPEAININARLPHMSLRDFVVTGCACATKLFKSVVTNDHNEPYVFFPEESY